MSGPKGRLLVVGAKDLTPERLEQMYKVLVEGQRLNTAEEGEVEAQQWQYPLAVIFINAMRDLWNLWQRMQAAERQAVTDAFQYIWSDSLVECRNFYNPPIPSDQSRAYTNFINAIAQTLVNAGLHTDLEQARHEALTAVCTFIHSIKTTYGDAALMQGIMQQFGAVGIFAYAKLVEAQPLANSLYAFPSNLRTLFENAYRFKGTVTNFDALVQYLAAAAYQAVQRGGMGSLEGEGALEAIARATLLIQQIYPQLQSNGWQDLRFDTGFGAPSFFGYKNLGKSFQSPNGDQVYRYVQVYGFIEPYLKVEEINRLISQIENAAQQIARVVAGAETRKSLIQIIDNAEEGSLDQLCGQVRNRTFSRVPTIIIRSDGSIACYSKDTDDAEALRICQAMGFPTCRIEPPSPTAAVAPTSEPPAPPTTLQVPIPAAHGDIPAACQGRLCLI